MPVRESMARTAGCVGDEHVRAGDEQKFRRRELAGPKTTSGGGIEGEELGAAGVPRTTERVDDAIRDDGPFGDAQARIVPRKLGDRSGIARASGVV